MTETRLLEPFAMPYIVSDRHLLEALDFHGRSASELGLRTQRAILAEGKAKRVKALEMQKHSQLALAAQEREAHASEAYEAVLIEQARATAELEELKASRSHARLTIEIWRQLDCSHRAISQYP